MSGLIINLATLAAGASRLETTATPEELELPPAEWPRGAQATLDLDRTGDLVAVRGRIRSAAHLECVRCTRWFDLPVAAELTVVADRAGAGPARGGSRSRWPDEVPRWASAEPARRCPRGAVAGASNHAPLPGRLPRAVPPLRRGSERRTLRSRRLTATRAEPRRRDRGGNIGWRYPNGDTPVPAAASAARTGSSSNPV